MSLPFFLFRFSCSRKSSLCFYPGNLIYSCLPLLPVATVPPLSFSHLNYLNQQNLLPHHLPVSPSIWPADYCTSVVHKTFFSSLHHPQNKVWIPSIITQIHLYISVFKCFIQWFILKEIDISQYNVFKFFLRKCYPIFRMSVMNCINKVGLEYPSLKQLYSSFFFLPKIYPPSPKLIMELFLTAKYTELSFSQDYWAPSVLITQAS